MIIIIIELTINFIIAEVPVWLKTLRLHKYSYLFRQMTYEEMLDITEEWLEAQVRNISKNSFKNSKIYLYATAQFYFIVLNIRVLC